MNTKGFTLIELVVAIFIGAVMSTLGYGALNQVIEHRRHLQIEQKNLDQLQRAIRLMSLDFNQMTVRSVRDMLGRSYEAALIADSRQNKLVTLTRGGRLILSNNTLNSLQRVDYVIDNGKLLRILWLSLDRTQETKSNKQQILDNVRSINFRFYDRRTQSWISQWSIESLHERPLAIEVTIDTVKFGVVKRLFEVPG